MSPGGYFEYNKDPNGTIYVIRRLDLQTNEIRNIIEINGGACRPQISPDGKTMAFVRRVRGKSVLSLFDLEQRTEYGICGTVWMKISRKHGRSLASIPDSVGRLTARALSSGQKAKSGEWMWLRGRRRNSIPAHVKQIVAQALRFPQTVGAPTFPVKVIRWPQVTPDGSEVIFQSSGLSVQEAVALRAQRQD